MYKNILWFTLIFHSCLLCAQDKSFKGKVVEDETGDFIQRATITMIAVDKNLYVSHTNDSGYFQISQRVFNASTTIKISAIGFKDEIIPVIGNIDIKHNYEIRLKGSITQLDEVVIKNSIKRYKKAVLNFSDSSFTEEVSVKSILANGYGFSIKNGQLFYNGIKVSELTLNGKQFFNDSDINIFDLMPALVLNDIEVITTNLDSLTNTYRLKDHAIVNISLKDKYKTGQFGNFSIGAGTNKRRILAGNLFSYREDDQTSVTANTNNIDVNETLSELHMVVFNGRTSNVLLNEFRLTHQNTKAKGLTLDVLIDGGYRDSDYDSQIDRIDFLNYLTSKINNKIKSRTFNVHQSGFKLNYKPDPNNELNYSTNINLEKQNQDQFSEYTFLLNNDSTYTALKKTLEKNNILFSNVLTYKRDFKKKGRYLFFSMDSKIGKNKVDENVFSHKRTNGLEEYTDFNNEKMIKDSKVFFSANYNQPISETSYLSFFSNYLIEHSNYNSQALDVLGENEDIRSNRLNAKTKFYKATKKFSLAAIVEGIVDKRSIPLKNLNEYRSFLSYNIDMAYNISDKENLSLSRIKEIKFPEIHQLTNINNTYDPLYQTFGNVNLEPETINSLNFNISSYRFGSSVVNISASINNTDQRIGLVIENENELQTSYLENLGNTVNMNGLLSVYTNLKESDYLSSSLSFNRNEYPTIINGIKEKNQSDITDLTLSLKKNIIENKFSITPTLSSSFSSLYFAGTTNTIYRFTYSDKLNLKIGKLNFTTTPLLNYNVSIMKTFNYAISFSAQYKVMKGRSNVWFHVYDLLNSFQFDQGGFQSTYQETVLLKSSGRFFVLGINMKLSSMK